MSYLEALHTIFISNTISNVFMFLTRFINSTRLSRDVVILLSLFPSKNVDAIWLLPQFQHRSRNKKCSRFFFSTNKDPTGNIDLYSIYIVYTL